MNTLTLFLTSLDDNGIGNTKIHLQLSDVRILELIELLTKMLRAELYKNGGRTHFSLTMVGLAAEGDQRAWAVIAEPLEK
jgi:hypothetical protein